MNAKIIQLPKIFDERGNLSFVEEMIQIPFKISELTIYMMFLSGQKRRTRI